jgi:hypothetical protein
MLTSPPGLPGDYNADGSVDAADYVMWRKGGPLVNEVHEPGTISPADYTEWRIRFGETSGGSSGVGRASVPEPATYVPLALTFAAIRAKRCGRRCQ